MNHTQLIRNTAAAVALTAAVGAQAAISIDNDGCKVDSPYDLTIASDHIEFSRDRGEPERIVMADGQLRIDGDAITLSAEDSARVRAFEDGVRELLPEVRAIGAEAIEIAYTAMSEVAIGLSDKPEPMLKRLERSRAELEQTLLTTNSTVNLDEAVIEAAVEELVGEFVPLLVGQVATAAIAAALSGNEARIEEIEARADAMEARIESQVEARAELLEERAESLCGRIAALDEIDDALDLRLADGSPLQLLRVK